MPQLQLPIFPKGMTLITMPTLVLCVRATASPIFMGTLPVFTHDVDDQRSFRMITSQFYVNGSAKQAEICRAFSA